MKSTQLLVFGSILAVASSTKLYCQYKLHNTGFLPIYNCNGEITTTQADYLIDEVIGAHVKGRSNNNVATISLQHSSIEVLPGNLRSFFTHYIELKLSNITKLPNFQRSDFYPFTELLRFTANKMNSITQLPRETFFDLTQLDSLSLDSNPNMENLHEDLLVNLEKLTVFSARGPNKIDQISPGFFRSQTNTLTAIDFTDTKLVRVSHSVFINLQETVCGYFENAGCLDGEFYRDNLVDASRAKCQDLTV